MSDIVAHDPQSEAAKAGCIDRREHEVSHIVRYMEAVLDAFEAAGEPVLSNEVVFDDLLPDENGEPYKGVRRWTRIGAGASTDTVKFLSIPSYIAISLSQPTAPAVRGKYAGGIVTLQCLTAPDELSTMSLYVRNNRLLEKSMVTRTKNGTTNTLELSDNEAIQILQRGVVTIANDLLNITAKTRDEERAARSINVAKQLISHGVVQEEDLDDDLRILFELYEP